MKWLVPLLLAGLCSACLPFYEMRWTDLPLEQAGLAEHDPARLQPNDDIYVGTKDGKRYRFTVTQVQSSAFLGRAGDHEIYRVPYQLLAYMEARRPGWVMEKVPDVPLQIYSMGGSGFSLVK